MRCIKLVIVLIILALMPSMVYADADWKAAWTKDVDGAMMVRYFMDQAEQKIKVLREKYPSESLKENPHKARTALMKKYLMPPFPARPIENRLIREVTVDGLRVEVRLMTITPGIYSVANIYKPSSAETKHPAILMLPGHGDKISSPGVQSRCLSFAKRGFLVMVVDPFGQDELTNAPLWNEFHDGGATAFLLTSSRSLLGTIMAMHRAEVGYLTNRPDVNKYRFSIVGASMGGTHTLWFSAIDHREKTAVGVAVAPLADPAWGLRHHCMCDTVPGLYDVADGDMLRALIAPSALMVISPDIQAPVAKEGGILYSEGKISYEEMMNKYRLDESGLSQLYPYARSVYSSYGDREKFVEKVVVGPHDLTPAMRDSANYWIERFTLKSPSASITPEPVLSPLSKPEEYRQLMVWPDGNRPADLMGPTEFAKASILKCVDKLPKSPGNSKQFAALSAKLRKKIPALISLQSIQGVEYSKTGELEVSHDIAAKYVVTPEGGVKIPMLVFNPQAAPKGIYVMLSPQGVESVADSPRCRELTSEGYIVACPNLRGTGITSYSMEGGAYVGLRDHDLCIGALKLGDTVAGYWTADILAVVKALRKIAVRDLPITLSAENEAAIPAIFAASLSDSVHRVETKGLLSSYYCTNGYGLNYAYRDPSNKPPVERNAHLGGYGSMVPCIPSILTCGDIPEFAAMLYPKVLVIRSPISADGTTLSKIEAEKAFAWTAKAYQVMGKPRNLILD